ncbi:MAG: hypothetical protein MJ065_09205 [Oscillospiraceae bacterium]|nr:hypothetical protein [Oscillospiraceae bacterium]
MSLLNMKFTEQAMMEQLGALLLPGEQISAAVYAAFREPGLFRSMVQAGFFGLTDQDRIISVRHTLGGSVPFAAYIGLLKKLRVKKGLLGSRNIEIDDGHLHLMIAATPKVGTGVDLPNQQANLQMIISALEPRQFG